MPKKYRGNTHRVAARSINKYLSGRSLKDDMAWPRDGYEATRLVASIVAGALILCIFPLLIVKNEGSLFSWSMHYSYSGFTQAKRDTMWLIIMLCTPLTLAWLGAKGWRKVNWADPARVLCLLYFLWTAVSAVNGSYAGRTNDNGQLAVLYGAKRFEGMYTQLGYCGLMLMFSLMKPSRRTDVVFAAMAMLLFFCITMNQYQGGNPWGMYPRGRSIYTNYEFQGTTGNIDMGGGYLTLISALLLAFFVVQGGLAGWISLIPGLMGVMLILMTGVESGKIGVYAMGILLLMAMLRKPDMRVRGLILLGALALVLTLR